MTMTMTEEMTRKHGDAMLKALERQRNEALTREVQKDAVNALLLDQAEVMRRLMTQKDADIAALKATVADLEAAVEALRKAGEPAPEQPNAEAA